MNILPERNRCPCLTHDVGLGLCTGFVIYPILMAAAGKIRDIRPRMRTLTVIAVVFLVIMPY
jgi:xanthine/uracil/vitamin C permease (AzgA family)